MNRAGTMTEKYKWAIDRLKKELTKGKILTEEFDWGTSIGVAYVIGSGKNRKVLAFMLEKSGLLPGLFGIVPKPYSLNRHRKDLNNVIREFRKLEATK